MENGLTDRKRESDFRRRSARLVSSAAGLAGRLAVGFLVAAVLASANRGQGTAAVTGVVVDTNGAAVAQASVRFFPLDSEKPEYQTETNSRGRFSLPLTAGTLRIDAAGFETFEVQLTENLADELKIVLSPAAVTGMVTVTGTESRLEQTAASVVALDRPAIEATAAATLDDRLRQVAGFSLFRRAGSRTANPTTQGVSLRGVGASGASRALVLADGVPLNDPFGSWIYWGRVPAESISQVEILRGPASDLYGSSAIGGVVSILTRRPTTEPAFDVEASYGNQDTPTLSAYGSGGISDWHGSLSAEVLRTDGFVTVDEALRGPVDTPANVKRSVFRPFLERTFDRRKRLFGSAEFFREERANGTPLQTNDTNLRNFAAGVDWAWQHAGTAAVRAYGGTQGYHQSFSAVAVDRRSESLTRRQTVPSQVLGLNGQWTGSFDRSIFIAGLDIRQVRGRSDETVFSGGRAVSEVSAGGRETTAAVFGGAFVPLGQRLVVSGGLRFDRWQNSQGYLASRPLGSGSRSVTAFPDRSESAVSPRASVLLQLSRNVSLTGTFARAFRRPTLNELYRAFRVGDILTLANENLRAERAASGEAAAIVTGLGRKLYFRTGAYCTEISRSISNVTLGVTPSLITRQRQNLGRTRACGIEADGQTKITNTFSVSGGYLFVDSRVTGFPANPVLEGLRVPQIPRHQITFQVAYFNPKTIRVAAQTRAASSQFDDDLNQLPLRGYFAADILFSRRLVRSLDLFAALENLFDARIESGRTPVLTLAGPRTFRLGIRFRFGRK